MGASPEQDTLSGEQDALRDYLSKNHIFSWHSYLAYLSALCDPRKPFSQYQAYAKAASKAEAMMTWVYLACNVLTLLLAVAALIFPGAAWLALAAFTVGVIWNYMDTIGGLFIARYQKHIQERPSAFINVLASLQLSAATTIFFVAFFALSSGALLTAISAAMGFSFAACMGFSALVELRSWYLGNKRLAIEETVFDLPDDLSKQDDLKRIQTYIAKDREIVAGYKSNVIIWLTCFVAMAAIASVSLLPLSAATQAILLVTIAAVCCITAFYRMHSMIKLKSPEPPVQSPKPTNAEQELHSNLQPNQQISLIKKSANDDTHNDTHNIKAGQTPVPHDTL